MPGGLAPGDWGMDFASDIWDPWLVHWLAWPWAVPEWPHGRGFLISKKGTIKVLPQC